MIKKTQTEIYILEKANLTHRDWLNGEQSAELSRVRYRALQYILAGKPPEETLAMLLRFYRDNPSPDFVDREPEVIDLAAFAAGKFPLTYEQAAESDYRKLTTATNELIANPPPGSKPTPPNFWPDRARQAEPAPV